MSLDWGKAEIADEGRGRRLIGSYAIAFVLVGGLLAGGAIFGGKIKQQVLQEEVEVKFVAPEKKPEPPPPPPAPPPPPQSKIKAATQGPPPPLGPKVDAPPTEIPKDKPREDDPSKAVPEVAFGEGDPNGCVGCTGKRGGGGGIAPAPSATQAAPVRPYQIAEVTTPPIALTKTMPSYPEEARKQGIDMVVVVKFVVTESGDVEDIKILSGHPTLDQVVIDAVKAWRFTPGTLDGKPVRVARKMKFPFHLRTANN